LASSSTGADASFPDKSADTVPAIGSDVVGSSVTFSAQFQGTLPIGYQWFRAPGTTYTNIVLYTTNCTFTIPSVQFSDSGNYRVIITNAAATNSSLFVAGKLQLACGTLLGKYFLKCAASGAVGVPLPALPVSRPRWQSQ